MAGQSRLDLAQLDAKTTDLHLVVGAGHELHLAVRPVAAEIAGAIEPVLRRSRSKWIEPEALAGELGIAQVTRRQVRTANGDLAELADAGQALIPAQHQELDVAHTAAQG